LVLAEEAGDAVEEAVEAAAVVGVDEDDKSVRVVGIVFVRVVVFAPVLLLDWLNGVCLGVVAALLLLAEGFERRDFQLRWAVVTGLHGRGTVCCA
jgi:hypothetical protein